MTRIEWALLITSLAMVGVFTYLLLIDTSPIGLMVTNGAGIKLIRDFEGIRYRAYQDGNRIWTCGIGHTSGVGPGTTCTPELAEKWLKEDLEIAESVVNHCVKVPVSSNQFSALVSLCYNIGAGNFKNSTALTLVNECLYDLAADAIKLWCKIDGTPNLGLEKRREAEWELFKTPDPKLPEIKSHYPV